MILYEFEAKKLLQDAGITVPKSQLIDSGRVLRSRGPQDRGARMTLTLPVILKAQVLSGKRADAGGIIVCDEIKNLKFKIKNLLGKTINKERVEKVLVEEMVEFDEEFYISLSYDTDWRGPVLTISASGGTGVEERETRSISIDPIEQSIDYTQIKQFSLPQELLEKLIKLFFAADCLLLEINPLVRTSGNPSTSFDFLRLRSGQVAQDKSLRTNSSEGIWVALDAKVKIDDTASGRHQDWDFPSRSVPGHTPTKREVEAKKIDEGDYRGTAGSTYFDLDGKPSASFGPSIAILASGGGASLTAMDALLKAGGRAANYTEYSGNPPKEKVEKLTKIVLSKPNLHGLWIVGALANFTDIYETLSGFMEGLRQAQTELGTKFNFPIVIRRAGPNDKKAFAMLRKIKDFDLHLFGEETSITASAKIMVELANRYKESSR